VLYQLSYLGAGPGRNRPGAEARGVIMARPRTVQNGPSRDQGVSPSAARNRRFSATLSRSGNTRGGSSAVIATRASGIYGETGAW
jgi:hypothetical protein